MGLFITLEGIEGCGKTTQAARLGDWLKASGEDILLTREPGGCAIADLIRAILLDPGNKSMVADTELLLYAAARAQHVAEVIQRGLADGKTVICDRFTEATLAYQGYGRGLDLERIHQLNQLATRGTCPDLILLLDFPAEEGLQRARLRNQHPDLAREGRFEEESLIFHRKVRDGYLQLARSNPRMHTVDACGSADTVAERIRQIVTPFLTGARQR